MFPRAKTPTHTQRLFPVLPLCSDDPLHLPLHSLSLIRSPPQIPEVSIPDEIILGVASALRVEINGALAILRDIASGKDLKKFLAVCFSRSFIVEELNFLICYTAQR